MTMQIQSTTLVEDGKGNATVALLISDNAGEDKDGESLQLQVRIAIRHDSYLPRMQMDATKRAVEILEEIQEKLRKNWK